MKLIPLTNRPRQSLQIPMEDKTTLTLDLRYLPAVEQWSLSIKHQNFTLNSYRVHNSFNMLHHYSLLIPFGIQISVSDGGEPFLLEDFSSGRVQFFILNSAEVNFISAYYASGEDLDG